MLIFLYWIALFVFRYLYSFIVEFDGGLEVESGLYIIQTNIKDFYNVVQLQVRQKKKLYGS